MPPKKNKQYQKLLSFYQGPKIPKLPQPDETRAEGIKQGLAKFTKEKCLKLGLGSSLRSIKNKKSTAIFYDASTPVYLRKFLIDYGREYQIVCLEIPNLKSIMPPDTKFKTLLIVSVEKSDNQELSQFTDDLARDYVVKSEKSADFKPPDILKIQSSGKSKAKKEKRQRVENIKETTNT